MAHSCQMANHLSQKPLSTPGQAYLSASYLQQQGLIIHAMCLLANESSCDKRETECLVCGLNCVPLKNMFKSQTLVPVNVTLFGSRNLQVKPS